MSIITKISSDSYPQLISTKRERLQLSQKEFATALGMSKFGDRTIRRWERGESKPSSLEINHILSLPKPVPFPNDTSAPYTMIDLFAGIGGTRLGFHFTKKTKVIYSSEIDPYASKTYAANFGELPSGDITKIATDEIPDHDVLVGGFPCQAFSQAGKKLGFNDVRGTLFFEIARVIKAKQPKAFLLENVRNLINHDHGRTFKTITKILGNLGYAVNTTLFKAKDFGLPQNRERIYIVGFHKTKVPQYAKFAMPTAPKTATNVGSILEQNVNSKYTISNALWSGHQRRKAEHQAKGHGFGYTLFNASSPYTNTISARYYKDGSEILIEQVGANPRKITPREAARLQGFPEEFVIAVSDTQAYKQFGNSVAVPVIHAIAKQILAVLDCESNS